ncbi:hypothetical protein FDP41_002367 [Naegleria fowleri]|uniref:Uncharacterized protein n=1 Tax=Naegleria fowleri TaxID=5763 RepID=A0A6A5BNC4_NAEFO|nr:uncharacterized protein FDP41_002367 [Naegleria fowleri]KAF0978547.1 hypothetical protein FDP41_002367 [Naegleria fowleri]CAG4717540.1 unnamed protein product [Naegleria fowleri]
MKEENYDLFVKILLVGDSGAGKTCLILRYTDDEYNDTYQSTIGVDFKIKTKVMSNSKVAKMQLWDTAGQERFNSIVVSYYRGVNGILVVFDLTNETSFQNTTKWIQQIKSNAQENTLIALVGNKSDMVHRRVVDRSRAEEFAKKLNIPYFEASAKDGTGVKEPFDNMLDRLYQAGNYAESEFNRRKNTAGSSSGTVNLNAPVSHTGANSSGKTSNSSGGGGCGC